MRRDTHRKVVVDLLRGHYLMTEPVKTVAEIGISRGETVIHVLDNIPTIETYYCVDPWEHYPHWDKTISIPARNRDITAENVVPFFEGTYKHRSKMVILPTYSSMAARHVPPGVLDFCFIDGNHAKDYVTQDIQLWLPKIRVGGILAGHDYGMGGVSEVVDAIFPEAHKEAHRVWWVRKTEGMLLC